MVACIPSSHHALVVALLSRVSAQNFFRIAVGGEFPGFGADVAIGIKRAMSGTLLLTTFPRVVWGGLGRLRAAGTPLPFGAVDALCLAADTPSNLWHEPKWLTTQPPLCRGVYGTNKPSHNGTGNNVKPWAIANHGVDGINPASDHLNIGFKGSREANRAW
jgi:hypothetical protein